MHAAGATVGVGSGVGCGMGGLHLGSILQREHEIPCGTTEAAQPLDVRDLPERDLHDVLALKSCEQAARRAEVSRRASSAMPSGAAGGWLVVGGGRELEEGRGGVPDWISIRLFVIL